MRKLDLNLLLEACSAGGPSCLSSTTPLKPAAGEMAAIAPAKYAIQSDRKNAGTYVFSTRFVNGKPEKVVLIDSSQSQSNRVEEVLSDQIFDDNPVLTRMPRIQVTYQTGNEVCTFTDLQLPHRAFDAHIRFGTHDGKSVTDNAEYIAARDAKPIDASALLNMSPVSLVFGSWDSTRPKYQGRWPSVLTGETLGVLVDQDASPTDCGKGGARRDPVGMSVTLTKDAANAIITPHEAEYSARTANDFRKNGNGSKVGLGGLPPNLSALGLVACSEITRMRVLSFAALRQIRFGQSSQSDVAIRALLASLLIEGIVRADAELYLRAHCELVEAGPTVSLIDRRHGKFEEISLPEVDEIDELFNTALTHACQNSPLDWEGQIFEVTGDPAILQGASDDITDSED